MRELYDELVANGEAAIDRLIGTQETVDLEFKTKERSASGEGSFVDRQQLGKILSAFANSAGGLIVWGIAARKDEADGIDRAIGVQPIADIERFRNWIIRACGEVLMPRHDRISIEAIPSIRHPGSGYIAIHVERSERRPHRSEVKDDKQYYKRAGDSSFAMEHYDIEDSFRRLTVPSLELQSDISLGGSQSGPQGRSQEIYITLSLHNPSNVTARYPYLHIDDRGPFLIIYSNPPARAVDAKLLVNGGADSVIHPEMTSRFLTLSAGIRIPDAGIPRAGIVDWIQELSVSCRYGCEHSRSKHQVIRIDPEPILNLLRGGRWIQAK